MPGGEIELSFVGDQDLYLVSNPQISFFKSVYKRYTNFSKEIKDIDPDSADNTLSSFTEDIKLNYKIPRNGDGIKAIYLEFDLPNIYSSDSKRFQWIKNLGEFIIKDIRLTGDNSQEYSRITGEYLHIYNNFNLSTGEKQQLDKFIGNTPDVYSPASTAVSGGIYPSSIIPSGSDTQVYVPSIKGRKIIIPIPFWFSQHLGNMLPLIALQRVELKIEVTLRPLNQWYTVIDTNPLASTFRTRIRPVRQEDYIGNYTTVSNNDSLSTTVVRARGEYIFLDAEERKRFAQQEHTYIMNQIQYVENGSVSSINGGNITVDIRDINHPVKRLWYLLRRTDNEAVNDWSNFTFLNEDGVNPLSRNTISDTHHNYELSYSTNTQSRIGFLTESIDCDIVSHAQLIFNGEPRFNVMPNNYFQPSLDILTHKDITTNESRGIYCISFDAKNKGEYQPSGSCNFSRIGRKELRLTLRNPGMLTKTSGSTGSDIGNYRVLVIVENINFFRIIAGLSNLQYSN
jgi:hypothetical protein